MVKFHIVQIYSFQKVSIFTDRIDSLLLMKKQSRLQVYRQEKLQCQYSDLGFIFQNLLRQRGPTPLKLCCMSDGRTHRTPLGKIFKMTSPIFLGLLAHGLWIEDFSALGHIQGCLTISGSCSDNQSSVTPFLVSFGEACSILVDCYG